VWHYEQNGSGRPLILLHGIGMSHAAWHAVTPYLSPTRRIVAFDIAGFGSTPPLPTGTPPTIHNLVDALVESIEEMGIHIPVDIAGNSFGGSLALAAAQRGIARTAVAISPAGLWRTHPPAHVRYVFQILRFMARNFPGAMKATVRIAPLRELTLALPLSVGSRRMPVGDAVRAIDDLALSTAFEETFDSTRSPLSATDIPVPVTVAFGDCDWILPGRSRCRDRLPAGATWIEPRGWGHVPMWADPCGVARLILHGTTPSQPGSQLLRDFSAAGGLAGTGALRGQSVETPNERGGSSDTPAVSASSQCLDQAAVDHEIRARDVPRAIAGQE
jgi:pimeloyl-ACP methyl ester carboxylesterase